MSNGRSTRRGIGPPAHIVKAAAGMECPDCDSDVSLRRVAGTWHANICHDDSCVQLRWRQRHGALHSLGLVAKPGKTIDADSIMAVVKVVGAQPGVDAVRVSTSAAAPGWQERQLVEDLLDPREQP